MKRPTMKDIAREAGVSRGAASFALNDRPGVSEETRARVKQVAERMGWTPSPAALALSSRRARAIGLVIARDHESFASESFFLKLISGIERVLSPLDQSMVLQVVPDTQAELATLRRWWSQGRVDAFLLVDPVADDPRPALLAELGLPAVVIGGEQVGSLLSGLATDDAGALALVVDHLHAQGHRSIAYVVGMGALLHTRTRVDAFAATATALGVTAHESAFTDFTEDAGRRETEALLTLDQPPTAIVYDNEILALGGLAAIHAAGLRCPQDVAIVSCEDSPVCRVVQPPLTALVRDPAALGSHAAELVLELVDEAPPRTSLEPVPELVVRGSSVTP